MHFKYFVLKVHTFIKMINILDQYCIQFVSFCFDTLSTSTKPIQVAILITLNYYVDKLVLLQTDFNQILDKDKEVLDLICSTLLKTLRYAIGINQYFTE
jgi:hypothetical protein